MFSFIVNHRSYSCPTGWEELTLSEAAALQRLVRELPPGAAAHFRSLAGAQEEIAPVAEADREALDAFWRQALGLLTGCPAEVLDRTEQEDINAAAEECLEMFVVSLLVAPVYRPEGIASFEAGGERLIFPETGRDVADREMPMHRITAKEFCDASDVVAVGELSLAPVLVAILCRPQGEPYDESRTKTRARAVADLPANLYLEAYFRLMAMHGYLRDEFPKLYGAGKSGEEDEAPNTQAEASWADRMLFVADDRPSELSHVEKMNAYEFVRLLDAKLKREKQRWMARMW